MGTGEFKEFIGSINKGKPVKVVLNRKELEKLETLYNSEDNHFELALYLMEVTKDREPDLEFGEEDFKDYEDNGEILFVFDPKSEDTSLYWWKDNYYFLTEDLFEAYEWETTPINEMNFWLKLIEYNLEKEKSK